MLIVLETLLVAIKLTNQEALTTSEYASLVVMGKVNSTITVYYFLANSTKQFTILW